MKTLPILDGLDEIGCIVQRLVGSCIQPGEATSQLLQVQRIFVQIALVEIGDFQLATNRRIEFTSVVTGLSIVEIQAGNRIIGARLLRFLFNTDYFSRLIELGNAVALRVIDPCLLYTSRCV